MVTYIIIISIIESIKERRAEKIKLIEKKERDERLKRDWENKTGVYWDLNSANKEEFERMLRESE